MIVSFKSYETMLLARGKKVKRYRFIEKGARRKLRLIEIPSSLQDLRVPPGNRLEQLKGDRKGQYGIRINNQFRICFRWTSRGAEDVEIVDYHS